MKWTGLVQKSAIEKGYLRKILMDSFVRSPSSLNLPIASPLNPSLSLAQPYRPACRGSLRSLGSSGIILDATSHDMKSIITSKRITFDDSFLLLELKFLI